MKSLIYILFFGLTLNLVPLARAAESHHAKEAKSASEEHGDEAGEKDGHGHAEEKSNSHVEGEKGHDGHEEHAEGHAEEGHDDGEEGDEEETSSSVGPGRAVTEASESTGFKLAPAAMKTLEVTTRPAGKSPLLVSPDTIVRFKEETAIYRLRLGWYKLIEGEAKPQGKLERFIPHKAQDILPGDEIVVTGVPLLRVTELDAFSGAASGHAH